MSFCDWFISLNIMSSRYICYSLFLQVGMSLECFGYKWTLCWVAGGDVWCPQGWMKNTRWKKGRWRGCNTLLLLVLNQNRHRKGQGEIQLPCPCLCQKLCFTYEQSPKQSSLSCCSCCFYMLSSRANNIKSRKPEKCILRGIFSEDVPCSNLHGAWKVPSDQKLLCPIYMPQDRTFLFCRA